MFLLFLGTFWLGNLSRSGGQQAGPALDQRFCADVDGNGVLDLTDAVTILNYLYLGTATPYCVAQNVSLEDLIDRVEELESKAGGIKYLTISAEGFIPGHNTDYSNTYGNGGAYINSGSGAMSAPISIPQGSVIKEFIIHYYDNSASDLSCSLQYHKFNSGGFITFVNIPSSGTPGFETKSATLDHEVDYTTQAYTVRVWSESWDGPNMKIMGATILYETP